MTLGDREVYEINNYTVDKPEDIFICCASFEDRCLGFLNKTEEYKFRQGYVFVYDEPDEKREHNLKIMQENIVTYGPYEIIESSESDPVPSIANLINKIKTNNLDPQNSIITIDISTFTKKHLLLILKAMDNLSLWDSLQIIYTEPESYLTDHHLPMSMGLRKIDTIPGFASTHSLAKPFLLVIFLGYEGDRARALYENLDPNETILIVPKPAYREEWEGHTEHMNKDLIVLIGEDKMKEAHSLDPHKVISFLSNVFKEEGEYNLNLWNCSISPIGPKPQIVGLYLFWRRNPGEFSIIYAQPLRHNEEFYSEGIGKTWMILN